MVEVLRDEGDVLFPRLRPALGRARLPGLEPAGGGALYRAHPWVAHSPPGKTMAAVPLEVLNSVGLCWAVRTDHAPDPASMALLVAGVVLLAIGLVLNFEHQSNLWTGQMEVQLQARRRDLQLLGIIAGELSQVR